MKERPVLMAAPMVRATLADLKWQTRRVMKNVKSNPLGLNLRGLCPYGQPGDRLWVRETFSILDDGIQTPSTVFFADMDSEQEAAHHKPWKPSIFMPRAASRILLEVTEVRVQRLQDISEEDAKAEGTHPEIFIPDSLKRGLTATYKQGFANLWDSINGKRPGCTWNDNPWVWVISFKRIKP